MASISGFVKENGVAASGRTVRAYRRDTGALLGSAITSDGQASPGDPHFSNVSLLLHMDGTNGSTAFTDSSSRPKRVTVASGNPQISTAQSKFGGASAYFPGSARLLVGASADFGFGSGNYTFEAWVRLTARNEFQCLFDNRVGGAQGFGVYVGNSSGTACFANNETVLFYSQNVVPLNKFFHIAVVRNSGVVTIYLNGVSNGSAPDTRILPSEASCCIGDTFATGQSLAGYLDEVRITKGVARYTANFTPPTVPLANSDQVVETPSGSYTIDTGVYTGEVQIVCLDDDAGTLYNDQIARVFPV